jgi:hypothetical protein
VVDNASQPITRHEMRAVADYIKAAIGAPTDESRDAALAEGIVVWGLEFTRTVHYVAEDDDPFWDTLVESADELWVRWLGGASITRRSDEIERRALTLVALSEETGAFTRLLVDALVRLPDEHPVRGAHLGPALAALHDGLESPPADQDELDERLYVIGTLLRTPEPHAPAPGSAERRPFEDDLVTRGEALLPQCDDPGAERDFRIAALGVLSGHAFEARDRGDSTAQRRVARHARALVAPLVTPERVAEDPAVLAAAALAAELDEDEAAAMELYVRAAEVPPSSDVSASAFSGVLRTASLTGRHDTVLAHAAPAMEILVDAYARELDEAAVADRLDDVDRGIENIAGSAIATGRLDVLLTTVESASCARTRYRLATRRGRAGRRLRTLEAALWTAQRGLASSAEDNSAARAAARAGRVGRQISVAGRLRETHRQVALAAEWSMAGPSPESVSARLRRDEGVAVLATGGWGTALLLLSRADDGSPSAGFESELLEADRDWWMDAMVTGEDPDDVTGWAYVLAAPWEYGLGADADPRRDLRQALARADDAVGPRLAAWARGHGLRRLWVVPHGLLALVPWWASASLADLDVRVAPCLAMLPKGRGAADLAKPAIVVANPTDDLPATDAEATAVASRLARRMGSTTGPVPAVSLLSGEQCTEDVLDDAVRGAGVVHFSGHGSSELTDASRSALFVRPSARWTGPDGVARLAELARTAAWGPGGSEDVRVAEVSVAADGFPALSGRLTDEQLTHGVLLRHLEHGPTGTLLAAYVDGRLHRLAELWSAGDLSVSGALRGVRLAVLSACQSGGGGLAYGSDEFVGLPAALTLAGVRSVVCTAWTVDDVLAAVTADLFWELVCADGPATVDLYTTAARTRRRVADMGADEAVRRVESLRAGAPTGRARFLLEAAAARLAVGPDRPYGHPYDWAPLFVVGEPLVTWRGR